MNYTGERVIPNHPLSDNNTDIYKEHIIRYKFCLPYIDNKNILDLASGTGYGAYMLAKNGAKQVIGGDNDKLSVDLSSQKYKVENLKFQTMDAISIPYEDNWFDIVVSFETIEHIRDYKQFLSEARRVLKPGGKLILSTPNKAAAQYLKINNPHHPREFSQKELIDIISKYFNNLKIYGQRTIEVLNFSQKILKKIYQIYIKIKPLQFLKKIISDKTIKSIGQKINSLSRDCDIEPIGKNKEYLYHIIIAEK